MFPKFSKSYACGAVFFVCIRCNELLLPGGEQEQMVSCNTSSLQDFWSWSCNCAWGYCLWWHRREKKTRHWINNSRVCVLWQTLHILPSFWYVMKHIMDWHVKTPLFFEVLGKPPKTFFQKLFAHYFPTSQNDPWLLQPVDSSSTCWLFFNLWLLQHFDCVVVGKARL